MQQKKRKTSFSEGRMFSASIYILISKFPQETEKLGVEKEPPLNIRTKVGTPNKARELPDVSNKIN